MVSRVGRAVAGDHHVPRRYLGGNVGVNVRFTIGQWCHERRGVHEMLDRLSGPSSQRRVDASTQLVVDGFPRSGQSYFVAALRLLKPDLQVANHAHTPVVFERAGILGVPAICLVRHPAAAVASLVQFRPGLSLGVATRAYTSYHARVAQLPMQPLVVPFSMATGRLDEVIAAAADRFGLELDRLCDREGAEEEIRDAVILSARSNYPERRFQQVVAIPSDARHSAASIWGGATDRERRLLAEATGAYARVMQMAPTTWLHD